MVDEAKIREKACEIWEKPSALTISVKPIGLKRARRPAKMTQHLMRHQAASKVEWLRRHLNITSLPPADLLPIRQGLAEGICRRLLSPPGL